MGIAAAVAIPRFADSLKGTKIKSAVRTVSMACRYARSFAVLHQRQMALIFYPDSGEVELASVGRQIGEEEREAFLAGRDARVVAGLVDVPAETNESEAPVEKQIETQIKRELPEGVKILAITVNEELVDMDREHWAYFDSNGMCDPLEILLADDDDRGAVIRVDPVTGKVRVELERNL